MNRVWSQAVGITGLVLILWMGPSWGQVPSDNDKTGDRRNTGGGTNALRSMSGVESTGFFNTAYGELALTVNTADANVAFGFQALSKNRDGRANVAVGRDALTSNQSGDFNTAVGDEALNQNISGSSNTALGVSALHQNQGSENTAVGANALNNNEAGGSNTAVGRDALLRNTTGSFNTAIGISSLEFNQTGSNNLAVGSFALSRRTTGNNNVAIGVGAGSLLTGGGRNIYLGNAVGGAANESGTIRIGRTEQTRTFIAGIAGVPMSDGSTVVISSTGQLGVQMSSARYKRDIQTMGTRSQWLLQLRPVTFRYKDDEQGERHYGLIAEEVGKVYPELVTRGANGKVESVRYQELIPMLLNEVQHQQRQIAELKAQNERLRAMMVQQQERDAALAARLDRLEATAARAAALASR